MEGKRQNETVLVKLWNSIDPESGGRFTAKRYISEKVPDPWPLDTGKGNVHNLFMLRRNMAHVALALLSAVFCFGLRESYGDANAGWVVLQEFKVSQGPTVEFSAQLAVPAVQVLRLADGKLGVTLSRVSPEIGKRQAGWHDDLRVVFLARDGSNIAGRFAGESLGRSEGQVISTILYVLPEESSGEEISSVVVEGSDTPERRAAIAQERQKRESEENEIEHLVSDIPFPRPVTGSPFPFTISLLDSKQFSSSSIHGRVLLIDFWATWCAPCRRDWPKLRRLYSEFHGKGLEILGVSLEDSKETVAAVAETEQLVWPQASVGDPLRVQALFKKLGFDGIPYYLLLDRSGALVSAGSRIDLKGRISALLEPDPAQVPNEATQPEMRSADR